MFIYDKDKNISIFSRGKNGTTNFHNHYWMKNDNVEVGAYTDFDESSWLFATPLPAVEDMTRGCVMLIKTITHLTMMVYLKTVTDD